MGQWPNGEGSRLISGRYAGSSPACPTMFIIMLDSVKGYGRLFETEEEAKAWQEHYGIEGKIVPYIVDKSE